MNQIKTAFIMGASLKAESEKHGFKCTGLGCYTCSNADLQNNCLKYTPDEIGITE